ncbi:DUF4352 domain-containing protein [Salibacterium salarium]|uniref:DUF4352 domain-containing protein n=1 Tax=Salibacterium salarium TaxID=284579 RepID=A0A428N4S0_9BACI|nr:DUF4352 domain-containing protein [Salibacterium salarium]RSL33252.1 DUF4352 domain-containing protein [Salibacterium salarium]
MGKMLKGCLSVIVVLIVIGIIIAIFSGGDDSAEDAGTDTSEEESSAAEGNEESSEGSEEASEKETYSMGETAEVGNVEYTINEKTTASEVGPNIMNETASDMYVVLDVTFKNNGDEAVTVNSSYLKLKQGNTTFEADEMASMSANQNEDGSMGDTFFMEEVNPGSERNGKVVFDVAPDIAEANDLEVEAQEGIFGSVTEIISLSK